MCGWGQSWCHQHGNRSKRLHRAELGGSCWCDLFDFVTELSRSGCNNRGPGAHPVGGDPVGGGSSCSVCWTVGLWPLCPSFRVTPLGASGFTGIVSATGFSWKMRVEESKVTFYDCACGSLPVPPAWGPVSGLPFIWWNGSGVCL